MQMPPPSPDGLPSVGFLLAAILGSLPVIGLLMWGAVKVLSPITQALGRRIGGGSEFGPEARLELAGLRQEVDALRQELSETQERLDFTERVLAGVKPDARLGSS